MNDKMVQTIKEKREHSHFVELMKKRASKKDLEPKPYKQDGVDEKKIEELSKEIRDKGSARKKEKSSF